MKQLTMNKDDVRAAISGYKSMIASTLARVKELETRLQGDGEEEDEEPVPEDPAQPVAKRRNLSAAARRKVSIAQKKRWREYHRQKKIEAAKKVHPIRRAAA